MQGRMLAIWAFIAVAVGLLPAHVTLRSPNGGETLRVGSQVVIEWEVAIPHTTVGWDLWYSVTGVGGAWIPIAMGLPPGNISSGAIHTYLWIVPFDVSGQVRLRVRQSNVGQSYLDFSDGDLAIVPSLTTNQVTVPAASGGTVSMSLDAGPGHAGALYALAGSVSGTAPGLVVGPRIVPLNWDWYMEMTLLNPGQVSLGNAQGILGPAGTAVVDFTLAPAIASSIVGVTFHHAFAVLPPQGPFEFISNPVPLTITN